jgi:hypothetical protein
VDALKMTCRPYTQHHPEEKRRKKGREEERKREGWRERERDRPYRHIALKASRPSGRCCL